MPLLNACKDPALLESLSARAESRKIITRGIVYR